MDYSQIDELVDREVGTRPESYADFLRALAEAARRTASHLEHDWQDRAAARAWNQIAKTTDSLLVKVEKTFPF